MPKFPLASESSIRYCPPQRVSEISKPKITLYSNDTDNQSYLIYWRDLRSTGKDLLYNELKNEN